jgi:hypothetical protein
MPWDRSRPRSDSYGSAHAKARAAAAKRHQPTDPCTRCGHPLGPMGRWLHYDHSDDRTHYLGFAHGTPCPYCGKSCNVRAAALKANARRKARGRGHSTAATQLRW